MSPGKGRTVPVTASYNAQGENYFSHSIKAILAPKTLINFHKVTLLG